MCDVHGTMIVTALAAIWGTVGKPGLWRVVTEHSGLVSAFLPESLETSCGRSTRPMFLVRRANVAFACVHGTIEQQF